MRSVLFDVYGTLISTGNGSVKAAERILRKNGSDIDPEIFYSEWKRLHKKRMRQSGFITECEIFLNDLTDLYSVYQIQGEPVKDVQLMLESLYDRSAYPETADAIKRISAEYDVIIASNTDTEPLLQNFRHNGLSFGKIFTSEMLKVYKPDEKFYMLIIKELALDPKDAVFVGDSSEEDIIAPSRLGFTTVFIDRKKTGKDYGQRYTVHDLNGLCDILRC